ncbi:MAG: c-type cytochrome [Planctomycetales bacterium]|nr:c-type cytochrome [Planctomycetales bacterium]
MSYSVNGTFDRCCVRSLAVLFFCIFCSGVCGVEPRMLTDDFSIELVAEHPQIVTPISLTFDSGGRMLVVESHTHQRPDNYDGPAGDRIQAFTLTSNGSSVSKIETFYEGLTHTMSLAADADGSIYVATRSEIFRLRDTNNDGKADQRTSLVTLQTVGDYPHNGLSGLAFGPDGLLYFGMGENLGVPFEVVASDGSRFTGHGDGGSVFHCRKDGSDLQRYATGFWNPFGNCFDTEGRLYSVDNDPDGSPPCRLVHVVPTADYGYQFRYGRSGRHPHQTWTGDLPGTLGPIVGTGEAPCEIIPYNGRLLVASWGDHRIESYELNSANATVAATRTVIVQGDKDFRPVGMKLGPDGNIYFTDWVDRSYPVHRQGRIWRLKPSEKIAELRFPRKTSEETEAIALRENAQLSDLDHDDPYSRQAAVAGLTKSPNLRRVSWDELNTTRQKIGFLQAVRWQSSAAIVPYLSDALSDSDSDVQLYALRVVADAKLTSFRPTVLQMLENAADARSLSSAAATLAWLDQGEASKDTKTIHDRIGVLLRDEKTSPSVRLAALKYLPVDHDTLTTDWLMAAALGADVNLAGEAIRVLALRDDSHDQLIELANEDSVLPELRADAVSGIRKIDLGLRLDPLLNAELPKAVRVEAERVLRRLKSDEAIDDSSRPAADDIEAWVKRLGDRQGNAAAGRRVFFRAAGTACARCHTYDGRGSTVGPDLTTINSRATKRFLLESILTPSREISPRYVPVSITTENGNAHVGLPIDGPADSGLEKLIDSNGRQIEVAAAEIVARQHLATSIMPTGFDTLLSDDELRDLIAFLTSE